MGNLLSNKNEYIYDSSLVVCNAIQLQRRLLKHKNNSKIIPILEQVPYACNYMFYPDLLCTESSLFDNYHSCRYPLHFQLGQLQFDSGSKIILTKEHYAEILELEKIPRIEIPLSKDDQIKILSWSMGHNKFV